MTRSQMLAFVVLVAGCGEKSIVDPPADPAQIRVFHGAAGVGTINVTAGGQSVLSGIDYGSLSKPAEIAVGSVTVEAVSGGVPIAGQMVTLTERQRVTLTLTKTVGGNAAVSLSVASDTGEARSDRGNLRINSAPEAPRAAGDSSGPSTLLDVYVTPPSADLNGQNVRMSLESSYPSYSTFLYYEPGQWLVRFTRAGTKTVVAQAGPIAFAAGDAKAVVIRRLADGSYATRVETVPERP